MIMAGSHGTDGASEKEKSLAGQAMTIQDPNMISDSSNRHPEKEITTSSAPSNDHSCTESTSQDGVPGPAAPNQQSLLDQQKKILETQINIPDVKVNLFTPYRYADTWDWLIIVVSAICAVAGGAALPLLSILFGQLATAFQQVALDTIPYHDFESKLTKNVLYFIYIGIAEFVTIYVSTVGFIYTGEHITQKIREAYMGAILRQNIAYFDNLGAGEVTTRITADTNLIQDGISQKVGLTLTAIATFTTAFVIAYATYWKLALVCSSAIVCLLAVMGGGGNLIVKFSVKSLQSYAVGGSVAEEVLNSIRTATAFGSQERLAQKYEAHLKTAEKDGIRMQVVQAVMVGFIYAILFLNYGLGFWQGSRFLVNGEVDVGKVLTIVMAISNGSYALGNVAPNNQAFTRAMAAAAKIYSTIDRQSPLDPTTKDGKTLDKVEGSITLRNVTHVYPSRPDVMVMNGVNLSIPAGRTTALVGPSGSGKSTIIGLVERFYNPVGGEIYLDGHNIQSLNLRWLRQNISLVSQEPILFSTTIFENIKYGLIGTTFENDTEEKLRERVEEASKKANAHRFITSLPDGYETNVGAQGFLLSGGQKQRVAIARAVVSDPKILLLDEATSALDTKSEGIVQAALDKAAEGRTTIVIAHRLSTIQKAHNIVVLVDGKIREQGTHDELLNADGEYFKLAEAQRLNKEKSAIVNSEDDTEVEHDVTVEEEIHILESKISRNDPIDSDEPEQEKVKHQNFSTDSSEDERPEKKYSLGTLIMFVASLNRPEIKFMTGGFVFAILAGGGQPIQSVLYAKSINSLSLPESMYGRLRHEMNFWALMLLILGLAQFVLYVIQGICLGLSSEKLTLRARSQAFRAMLRQDIAFFDKEENTTGALTSFLSSETNNITGISGVTLGTILMVSTTFIASMVIALGFGWKLALVCISIVPVLLFCGFYRVSMLAEFQRRSRKAYEASASYACEATSAIRTVASLTREDDVMAAYHAQLGRQARDRVAPVLKSSAFYALSQALTFFCMALAFWYGGTLLGQHEYSIFQFFLCFSQVIFGAQAVGSIFSSAPDMAKAKNAASEFKKLFDRRPGIDVWSSDGEDIKSVEGSIEFREVFFRYPTRPSQPVLTGLNLTVKPGQYVALVGGSGCGKSTTISLLERFYDASSGGVYVDGTDISQLNVNSYRNHLALVGQEPTLYQGTIRDNILLGSNDTTVSEDRIIKACKDANIYDFITSLPEGMETIVGSKGSLLSGGQKQRVAIARALLRDPRILLLDEATSALDSESEKVVQAALDVAARGRTTIAVAHRLSTIQKADVIYVLEQGRVVESGNHHELIELQGRYYELVNMQSLAGA